MKHIVSFSGGKDSTAMLLRLLEEGKPVDDIVFFDTGWEFPQLVEHVFQVQEYIGRDITVLHPRIPFNDWMFKREIRRRAGPDKSKVFRVGNGWPSSFRRWCTREKVETMNRFAKQQYGKFFYQYVGFAADELKRTGCGNACAGEEKGGTKRLYPLIYDWDMDEKDCLQYCYDREFTWGGVYQHFRRVSCFCCPLQRLDDLRTLRRHYPGLWAKMLEWDAMQPPHNHGFYGYKTVHDLDRRFAEEDRRISFL
jgi:3'-phosphoadenosine 5'-phosphosulfate sulfotransferase (PAPS reductase)/FAD synthetase